MSPVLWYALAAALGNVLGGIAVARSAKASLRLIEGLVAFGAGFMLAVAVVELLPEALERGGAGAAVVVLAGYLLVHLAQHTATEHFHFGEETHSVAPAAAVSALVGLSIHTFFDGVAIASGFAVSGELGVLVFFAVLLHKLPEGVSISSLQLAVGGSAWRAVGSASVLGLATMAGVLLTDGVSLLAAHGLALSAGVTLYVGASNLVPEFQAKPGWRLPLAFFGGAGGFFLTRELLRAVGG